MFDPQSFNDSDTTLIRNKMNWKYDRAMILTLIFSIPLLFISSYIPSKRGVRFIDSMEYINAFILLGIIWFCCLIAVYLYNKSKVNKEYDKLFRYFRKKEIASEVMALQKNRLNGNKIVTVQLENELNKYEYDPVISDELKVGDKAKIQIEENTQTVLKIEKYNWH